MFHLRWAHRDWCGGDAGPMLIFWNEPAISDEEALPTAAAFVLRTAD